MLLIFNSKLAHNKTTSIITSSCSSFHFALLALDNCRFENTLVESLIKKQPLLTKYNLSVIHSSSKSNTGSEFYLRKLNRNSKIVIIFTHI